jgi:hypothetical protein
VDGYIAQISDREAELLVQDILIHAAALRFHRLATSREAPQISCKNAGIFRQEK